MFRDFGFVWYLAKDFFKFMVPFLFVISAALLNVVPAPWDYVCLAMAVVGWVYFVCTFVIPLLKNTVANKHKEYRDAKEKAWNIIKEN